MYISVTFGFSAACWHDRTKIPVLAVDIALALTLALNILLACMITGKLILARRDALALGERMAQPASQYLTTMTIVVESALMWIVAIALNMISFHFPDGSFTNALWPFFDKLVKITSVSIFNFLSL